MKKKSIDGIQYLRGFAAVLVVLNHLWPSSDSKISNFMGFNILGEFGVDIFFIITGFIMAYTLADFNSSNKKQISLNFIKRRFERIYPLHLILLVPALIIYFHRCNITNEPISISSIVGSILLLPDFTSSSTYRMLNHVEWSLVYEMLFYFTLTFFILITKSKNKALIFYSLFIFILLTIINQFGISADKLNWVNFKYIIGDNLILCFILGFAIYYLHEKISFSLSLPSSLLVILLLTMISVVLDHNHFSREVAFFAPAFLIVSLCTFNEKLNEKKIKPLLLLGNASYAIYLTHPLFESFNLAMHNKQKIIENSNAIYFISCSLAILLGVVFHVLIEKRIIKLFHNSNKKERIYTPSGS